MKDPSDLTPEERAELTITLMGLERDRERLLEKNGGVNLMKDNRLFLASLAIGAFFDERPASEAVGEYLSERNVSITHTFE